MRRGYKAQIRAEAISLRSASKAWKEIQDCILEKYEVKPSIRQMQEWYFDFKRGDDDPTGEKRLVQLMEERFQNAITLAEGESGITAMEFSCWLASQNAYQKTLDMNTAIVNTFYLLESNVGRESFDKALSHYQRYRADIFKYKLDYSDFTGAIDSSQPDNTEYIRDE